MHNKLLPILILIALINKLRMTIGKAIVINNHDTGIIKINAFVNKMFVEDFLYVWENYLSIYATWLVSILF